MITSFPNPYNQSDTYRIGELQVCDLVFTSNKPRKKVHWLSVEPFPTNCIKYKMKVIDLEDNQKEFKPAVSFEDNLKILMLVCSIDLICLTSTVHA